MAHPQQKAFCGAIKARFPQYFNGVLALDIGSLDLNGNNLYLFDADCQFLGIDVAQGRNVDIVSPGHLLGMPPATFDVILSTECLEHDRHWEQTLNEAVRMLRPGGMLLMTCATTGRPEHGTRRTTPHDAPLLASVDDEWADYYRNLDEQDVRAALDVPKLFQMIEFSVNDETHDLYCVAIKHGVFERRLDRSIQIASHPVRMQEANLRAQLQCAFEALHQTQAGMASLTQNLAELREQIASEQADKAELVLRQSEQTASLERELAEMRASTAHLLASKSWRVTYPLRLLMTGVRTAGVNARRARNALGYVVRGDFSGLRQRLQARATDKNLKNFSASPMRWCVMATAHTLFIGHLIANRLRAHGWGVEVMTSVPAGFPHDMYVVVCPQMFKDLPPGEKRIAYQMEQSVSSRWFTEKYLKTLENSLAVLEYALVNIEFMAGKGVAYPHVHYLPVGADASYIQHLPAPEKAYDVLFYGDSNSSPRRRAMLDTLRQHFDVRVCSEVFGQEMLDEISRARVVINLHYYENALLEMPRIQECLSLGVPVVSESAQDQDEYPDLSGAVLYFEQGNETAMIDTVHVALAQGVAPDVVAEAAKRGATRFAFMFDRFLVAMNFLSPASIALDTLPLAPDATRIALAMPETITRRRIFEANRPQDCAVFDGVRLRPGWVGCGLSYYNLARHALKHGIDRLTVLEDDAVLPKDFEEKMSTVHAFLDSKGDQWHVFAGVIAILHPDINVLNVETFQGMRFVTIDKMTSTVCNVYSRKGLSLLAAWNSEHRDDRTNTIDKYLERQAGLRVVVALPFLVGHREEVFSTLWGFQNSQYGALIDKSARELEEKTECYRIQTDALNEMSEHA
ncbi:MAG: methyltransferase domain-containing protein [Burkholderiales bacterium]